MPENDSIDAVDTLAVDEAIEAFEADVTSDDQSVLDAAEDFDADADEADAEPTITFGDLGLPEGVVRKLAQNGVTTPFPIQAATIPDALAGKDILVVEYIIDSGLTLSWLLRNLRSRQPASVEVVALLRKPEAAQVQVPVKYMGFDIPSVFVVGYGLDYAERYRELPYFGTLRPEVYAS